MMTDDNSAISILVVEDDPTVQVAIKYILHAQSYKTAIFGRADEAWNWLYNNTPNVAILDVNLPDDSGFNLASKIRKNFDCGILILSERSSTADVLHGLELGADQYIVKPFLPRELLLRVNNLILRNRDFLAQKAGPSDTYEIGQWQFLRGKRLLMSAHGVSEKLTALEAALLQILVSSPSHVFDREVLIQKLHGGQKRPTKRTIDLLIMNLRRKLDEPKGKHRHIITVAGSGYYFQA